MSHIVNPSTCKHARKLLIAQDEEAEYWECLDCGELYEAADLLPVSVSPSAHSIIAAPEKIDESLSDA